MTADHLNGAVAVVSGASSGIGWATARALAARGATVHLLARRADRLAELVGAITSHGGDAVAHEVDVTDADRVRAVIEGIGDARGIDVLINNAGFLANGQIGRAHV